ncbi:boule-like isoform X2, partial [Paramuricea clavata]
TSAYELADFFEVFGHVTETKIILDGSGLSKGYGFVTFEQRSTVSKVESMGIIYFKNKKINIGPAVKKEATICQPEIVMWPQSSPVTSATTTNVVGQQTYQSPYYNNLGYLQQPQQPLEPYGGADCYGYYVVTNDGVLYWMMHPMAGYNPAVINQNMQPQMPYSYFQRDYRSNSSSSSSDDEIKVKKHTYNAKRKDIPPRFKKR